MAQRFENLCSIAVLLMLFTNIHCTSEIVAEKCEDQYGADLNGKLFSIFTDLGQ